jgi:hypothetical protein
MDKGCQPKSARYPDHHRQFLPVELAVSAYRGDLYQAVVHSIRPKTPQS